MTLEFTEQDRFKDMVLVPGGSFTMGSTEFYPEEAPLQTVRVSSFWMDKYEVTNEKFRQFVKATGYVTFAETPPKAEDYPDAKPELLVAGSLVFHKTNGPVDLRQWHNWWRWVLGASWQHPDGPTSSISAKENHPVVHISFADAEAYCKWNGNKTIPTEAQWEYASRGGLEGTVYTWGNTLKVDDKYMANTWQGNFPYKNDKLDGFSGTAPVGSFPANRFNLYDMAGNIWEWTSDWYGTRKAEKKDPNKSACCAPINPRGAEMEESYDKNQPDVHIPRKILKGGSYLCAPNYCLRYRPAARIGQMIDSTTSHIGFRCVVPVTTGIEEGE